MLSDGRPLWNADVWFCLEFGFYPSPPTTQLVCVSPPPLRVRHYEYYGEAIRISCSSTSPTSEGRLRRVSVLFEPSQYRPPATMALAFRDSAILVLPRPRQEPLWILNAEDFVPVVWNGGCSFFVASAGSFFPSHDTFYFVLQVSHTLEGVWYVWAPARYRDRIRVSYEAKLSPCE